MKTKIIKLKTEDAKTIERLLKENGGYCPCSILENADTKCMCKKFREEKVGVCHCGLYEKVLTEEEND